MGNAIYPNKSLSTSPNIKQFVSDAAFCNLTSPFATDSENKLKERIYNVIRSNQFPTDCSDKIYWINSMEWKSGLGWIIHQIALGLLTAVAENKIFIWGTNYDKWPFIQSPFCKTMECYFEAITNCTHPKVIQYSRVHTLRLSEEVQTFWNPILDIETGVKNPFLSRSSHEYTFLVTIVQWYLLRYNDRTKRIIANNIASTLNMMHLNENTIPNPNQMMLLQVRHSDKCYNNEYHNNGAEMLCFEAEHIVTIAQQIQFLYGYNGEIKYGIVNSEDSNIIQEIMNSSLRSFYILTNINDIRPETGDPKVWSRSEDVINNAKVDTVENDYMTSMLTVAQLSVIPRYWLYSFSSNWFFYLSHFRSILKCWPHNMDKEGDIQIELMSYCKLCPKRLIPGERVVIYKSLKNDVYEDQFIVDMLSTQCVYWLQKYYTHSDSYEVHCKLTETF